MWAAILAGITKLLAQASAGASLQSLRAFSILCAWLTISLDVQVGPDVRAAILAGITKLLAQAPAGASLPPPAEELLHCSVASHSLDLQQRALEAIALHRQASGHVTLRM